jgi:pimeloyl-ACP methyl ester carboxylesterase
MRFLRKHRCPLILLLLGLLVSAPIVVVRWATAELASPPRRDLMDYHREFLADLPAHGIRVEEFTAQDGTPCLVVSPAGSPGERGKILRNQLTERGFRLSPFGEILGTLVLLHGRKGRKEDYLGIAERFAACGLRCVIPDLPGHGDHPGKIATYGVREAMVPARVLDEAASRFGFEPKPSGLMGISMGGSVAIHAAALPDAPWSALIVVASFDSLGGIARNDARRRLGHTLGDLLADEMESLYQKKTGIGLPDIRPLDRVASVQAPTLIAHGTADSVVPFTSGKRLHDALSAGLPRKWIEIPDAGHDNVLITDFPIYAEMTSWFLNHLTECRP